MKKVLLGFVAFTLSLSLAACSSNDSEKVSIEKETPQASTDVEKKTEQKESTKEKTADKSKEKDKKELVDVTLDRAVDGDTIKVSYNGNVDTVRYLLVDTPETKKPHSCVQPYGEDASKRNKELVNSGKLQLEFDKGDRRDKYGRLLAYVYVDGKSVQETLLKEGLA
ncbi:endonuclease YokF, partial [Bacillus subtilis]|nr:endonuclease YokF [Bacillus subtilis]